MIENDKRNHLIDKSSDFINIQIESESYKTMLASEKVLSKDWNTPDEDEAWAHL